MSKTVDFFKRHKTAFIVVAAVTVIAAILVTYGVVYYNLTNKPERKFITTNNYVKELMRTEYGCTEILWITYESGNVIVDGKNVDHFYWGVGLRGEEQVFVCVPIYYEEQPSFETDWMFDLSFTEIIDRMTELGIFEYYYEYLDSNINIISDHDTIVFYGYSAGVPDIYDKLDSKSAICVFGEISYLITQEDHVMKLYTYDYNTEHGTVMDFQVEI